MADESSHVEPKAADGSRQERAGKHDKQLLETFWELAATADEKRVDAAGRLIDIVTEKQKAHESGDSTEVLCEEVHYVLKRLVRGLASPRKGARQGFAMAMAQLLENVEKITLADLFQLIKDHLEVKGPKSEEKQCLFGKAFAYLSIIQSGKLQKEDGRFSAEVIRQLQNLGIQKGFLEDICFRAVTELISRTTLETFEEDIWPTLRPELRQGWGSCSPYTLALLVVCKRYFTTILDNKFMQKYWGSASLLDGSNLKHIARIIAASTATSHPNPHAVCDILLAWVKEKKKHFRLFWQRIVDEHLCTSTQDECIFLAFRLLEDVLPSCSTAEIRAVLSENLLRCFISHLANRQSSLYRAASKLSGTLATIVKGMEDPKAQLALARCLLDSPGHFNFDEITKSRTVYNITSSFNPAALRLYLAWLKELFIAGSANIGNKESPDVDSGRQWVAMQVLSLVRNPKLPRETDWMRDCFQFLFLHAFFRVRAQTSDIPGCETVLDKEVSETLRQQIGQYFYSALGVVSNMATRSTAAEGEEEVNEEEEEEEEGTKASAGPGELWVYVIVSYAQDLLNCPNVENAVEFSEEDLSVWKHMMKTVEKLSKARRPAKTSSASTPSAAATAAPAFQLLFLHIGLQMFSETEQAVDILQDLHGCYERALNRRKSFKKKSQEEPEWVEVVVEILLSLLSKSSHLLRTVVDAVFKVICPHMTREALQLLLDILDPTKGGEDGNMEIVDSGDDEGDEEEDEDMNGEDEDESDEEEEEDDDDEEEEDEEEESKDAHPGPAKKSSSKKKPLSNGHGNHGSKAKDGEDSESDMEEDSEEEEEDDVDDFFRNDIKNALGDAVMSEDDSDDVASDFDDETMMKLDTALTQLFKAKMADRRKGKKEANTILLHFRLRVLDLLDIFIKRQQANPLILDLVLPLLVVIQTSSVQKDQHVLAEKAGSIYRNKLCRLKKYPHNLTEQRETLHQTVEAILQIAKKATSVMTVSLASAGCLFLIRVLRGNVEMTDPSPVKTRHQLAEEKRMGTADKKTLPQSNMLDVERITKLYSSAMEDFMTHRGTSLHPLLFLDLIERFPNLAWHLAEDLVSYITAGCQLYRKTQACRLLAQLMCIRPVQTETSSWSVTGKKIMSTVPEVLQSMLDGELIIKPKYLLQLLFLLRDFVRACHAVEKVPDLSKTESLLGALQEKVEVSRSGELTSAVRSVLNAFSPKSGDAKATGKRNKRKKSKRNKRSKRARSHNQ